MELRRLRLIEGVSFLFGDVTYQGKSMRLPARQFDLLKALVEASPESITVDALNRIGYRERRTASYPESRAVKVHIRMIRQALIASGVPLRIEQRRGFGYRCVSL